MAVAFDANMTGGNFGAGGLSEIETGVASITAPAAMTVGASASALVAVFVWELGGSDVTPTSRSATWNGVTMTEAAFIHRAVTNGVSVGIYVLPNPATGTHALAGSWTNSVDVYMSCTSFTGTDTTTVVNTGHSTTASDTTSIGVTSDANGATVAAFGANGAAPTVNFNKIFSDAPYSPGGGASYQIGGSSNSHTFTGAGGTNQALAGVHIIAASAGGTSMTPVVGAGILAGIASRMNYGLITPTTTKI